MTKDDITNYICGVVTNHMDKDIGYESVMTALLHGMSHVMLNKAIDEVNRGAVPVEKLEDFVKSQADLTAKYISDTTAKAFNYYVNVVVPDTLARIVPVNHTVN